MTQPISAPTYGTLSWFARAVGRYLQYGEDANVWSHTQDATVQEMIDSGLMRFYYPPAVEMSLRPYQWSFLRPVTYISTVASTRAYDLPATFDCPDGNMTYDPAGEEYPAIEFTSEVRLRQMETSSEYEAAPRYAAVRAKTSTGAALHVQELILHPTPDAVYKLYYQYHARPIALSATYPYPLGGPSFAEAIKAACLAEAEMLREGKRGPQWQGFIDALSTAIAQDLRRGPDLLGYNGDNSTSRIDPNGWSQGYRDLLSGDVTYTP